MTIYGATSRTRTVGRLRTTVDLLSTISYWPSSPCRCALFMGNVLTTQESVARFLWRVTKPDGSGSSHPGA